ncbi:MAG: lamin tail domain-containing protein [Phycisphaerae bacterium]|nr:lamin tail domain-containing protein [Phycisphaerae bacterium]
MKKQRLLKRMMSLVFACILLLSVSVRACFVIGDLNGDCQVDIDDLVLMASQWMQPGSIPANLDGEGDVDLHDFAILAGDWGKSEQPGYVTVNISGTIPTGGQWCVDGSGPWYNSGDTASGITVGAHTVTFADVAGYNKPADEPFAITLDGTPTIETLVTMASSEWKYLYDGSDQGTAWRTYGFDDSLWGFGPGQLGFGDGDETTDIGPKVDGRRTAYFRHKFNGSNVSELTAITITVLHDDGAVVYINDQEIGRINMPAGTVYFDTLASALGENTNTVFSEISPSFLIEGDNIITVEVHQRSDTSSDISFDLNLEATRVNSSPGSTVVNAGAYTPYAGSVTVNIAGTVPTGGQWQVNDGSWNNSGDTESDIPIGEHTVTFAYVAGYTKPADEPVTITNGGTAVVNAGAYAQQTGTLVVNISPQQAINDGAQWRVDGGSWRDSGVEISQAVGTHTVEFSSVFGWQKPSSVQVAVSNGEQSVVDGEYTVAPSTGLQINEFMADNDSRSPLVPGNILDGDLMSSDWIEIYNNSESAEDISDWYLTDEADQPTKWQFPSGMSQLQPGDYLIVFASGKTQEENPGNYPYSDGTYYHTNFQLDKGGEYLALIHSDGTTVVHEYNKYPDQEENFSYGLSGSDPSYFAEATPGAANTGAFIAFVEKPDVNIEGGCYETAIDVTLSCDTIGSTIRYTTDGSNPTATGGTLYTGPIHIDSLTGLIAKGFKTDYQPSKARIEAYIFVDSGVASFNSNLPIVVIDTLGVQIPFAKDQAPEVQYIDYRAVIIDTDDVTGRADITGPEHFAGIGQIRYRGESTYQTPDFGRGRGQYAIEILDEYHQDKEVSLLGMPPESDWILNSEYRDLTMLKGYIAFKWFRDMGHWASRQKFAEVYINEDGGEISTSDYRGIFGFREKIKRDKNRVDIKRLDALHDSEPQVSGGYIIKNDKGDYGDVILDLETSPYGIIIEGVTTVVEPDYLEITTPQKEWIQNYINEFHSVLWQNTASSFYPGPQAVYTDYIDPIHWIDDFLVEEAGYDKDVFRFSSFAHKDRDGKFCAGPPWDFDLGFHSRPYDVFEPPVPDRIPWRWHQGLQQNLEYRIMLADRWFEHRKVVINTALTLAHIDETVALITEAMDRTIAHFSYTYNYATEITSLKTWITNRLNWLDFRIADPSPLGIVDTIPLDENPIFAGRPPILSPVGGYVNQGSSVGMSLPLEVKSGTIYYTLDGEDPRLEGGAINPNASSGGSVTLNKSTCLKVRIKDIKYNLKENWWEEDEGLDWSAMNTEVYAIGPVLENLRISELMYHPTDPTPAEIAALDPDPIAEDFEFIELKNIGGTAINLNLVHFTDGIDFTFGDYTLAAGDYAVLIKNQAAFAARYNTAGINIVPGSYLGSLDNDGEEIVLRDAVGTEIHDFDYKDGWYELTDGKGYSLTVVDPASTDPNDWDTKFGWRSSLNADGTPGQAPETVLAADSIVINEVLAHSHAADPDWIELHNTTGSPIDISGWFLSDDDSSDINIRKYELQTGSIVPANGYLTLEQDVTFGNIAAPGCNIAFGLSEGGETVYLYSGAAGAVTGYYQTQQKFDASETDVTFGRYEKAELSGGYDFVRQSSSSQGTANNSPLIPAVVMTEIYYNPPSGGAYEFVELYNRSGSPVTLMSEASTETSPGVFITENIPWRLEGTGFEFPTNTTIPADTRILVAKTPALYSSAPCAVYGPYDGALDNGGEEIEIQIPGDQEYGQLRYWIPIEKIDYDDVAPWPTSADGGGDSLNRNNINAYSRDYSNWNAATPTPGS